MAAGGLPVAVTKNSGIRCFSETQPAEARSLTTVRRHAMSYGQNPFNPFEKQRLRDTIRREVDRFLARGGAITVLESAGDAARDCRASVWQESDRLDDLLD